MNKFLKVSFFGITLFLVSDNPKLNAGISAGKYFKMFMFKHPKRHLALFKERLVVARDILTNRTIYIAVSGMDCDHSTFSYVDKCKNHFDYKDKVDDIYQWADGITNVVEISKQEFEEFEAPESRDLALEAFEDGHSHNIHC